MGIIVRVLLLLLTAAPIVCLPVRAWAVPGDELSVRFGVFEVEPLSYKGPDGRYRGAVIEVIEAVASKEGWRLDYVPCAFPQCLSMLESGEIDLMGPNVYNAERAQRFDYTEETFFMDWGVIYVPPGSNIKTIIDLQGRRLAVLRNTAQFKPFMELVSSFGIKPDVIFVDDYADVFRLVKDGRADALMVNRIYGERNASKHNVARTAIIFSPMDIRYATPKGKHSDLREAIDRRLREMLADHGSVYYKAVDGMFEGSVRRPTLTRWAKWAVAGAFGTAVFLLGASLLLRNQVRLRTEELRKACENLKSSEEKYRAFINASSEGFISVDRGFRVIEANDALLRMLGRERGEVLGLNATELMERVDGETAHAMFLRAAEMPHRVYEARFIRSDGSFVPAIVNATTAFDQSGAVAGSSGFITDVSALKDSLREKELLLKEVHHRVKNNLQIVSSLMSLQSRYTHEPVEKRLFEESRARVMAMAMVHELLYQQNDLASMDAGEYLKALAQNLANSFGVDGLDATVNVDAAPMRLGLDELIPVGLIVTELFTNALKYGKGPDGKPYIHLTVACSGERGCLIEVSDNGAGLPAGFDPTAEGGTTLGLLLVRTLVMQLDGNLEYDTSPHGTAFRVRFNKAAG